jgi:hypothetical protein
MLEKTALKKAGLRIMVSSVVLAAVSVTYYVADQSAAMYRELDGYLPLLPIVRLALAIVAAALILGMAYPARVLLLRPVWMVRARWRHAAEGAITDGGTHGERLLDAVCSLAALVCAYVLIAPLIPPALLPLHGLHWVGPVFAVCCLTAGALLVLWLFWESWMIVGRLQACHEDPPARVAPGVCAVCGVASPPAGRFCRSCGAKLDGGQA